ncbi:diacylglycerol/lipid kinase family protein [Salipiger mangrovisoli]|uniref:NAD(+)/NADH kinase n=1 Tax=Salipiger mangrovisoli TaxID=2865933 RepID=A0ABR9X6U4_9RHOB|nr:diacylglycerol kinase family protein [Salipiger mangrovisoli]MBE9639325.1 NAD(+)/NADH kinase [Salipiger mangrovisoli]
MESAPVPDHRKICVILNEHSGDHPDKQSRREKLTELFAAQGLEAELIGLTPEKPILETARKAAASGCEMIVAAGGDGTIGAVAAAAHEAGVPMGVIPQGTFNYFARGLDIPEEPEGAVRILATGRLQEISLGEVNGEVFLNNASLGIYPLILRTREGVYQRWGRSRIAAYWSVVLALAGFRHPLRLRAEVDGRDTEIRTPLAFVANSAYQLDQFNLDGADAIRDGDFVLFTSKGTSRWDLVRASLRLAMGKAQKGEEFGVVTGREITLHTGRPRALVARDGEKELMDTPIRFRRRPEPLRVMVPAEAAIAGEARAEDTAA